MPITVLQPNYTHQQMHDIAQQTYYHPMGPGTGTMISFHGYKLNGYLDRDIRKAILNLQTNNNGNTET